MTVCASPVRSLELQRLEANSRASARPAYGAARSSAPTACGPSTARSRSFHPDARAGVRRIDAANSRVRFPAHIETTAWYGLAEALSNVVKRADATQVVVRLQKPDHLLTVAIEDNGRGFEPNQPRGLGLDGLADRLDIVGGHMTIDSAPGRGTAVTLEIPLRESASRSPATPAERRHQTIPTQPVRPEVVVDG